MLSEQSTRPALSTAHRALINTVVAAGVVVALLLFWKTAQIFLLGFAAILMAVLFQGLAYWLQNKTRLPYWASVIIVPLITGAAIGLGVWLAAPMIADQVETLRQELPQAIRKLHSSLQRQWWGRLILLQVSDPESLITGGQHTISKATTVFSSAFAAVGHIVFTLFIFLFVAFQPRLYRRGIELLVPPRHRDRASDLLDSIWITLWRWLAARAVAMAAVGVMTTVGLMTLGIPLAFILGLLAALLDFVPNFGPIVAAIPAILLAAAEGPEKAIYVALFYFAIQMIEGNIITPLAQKKAIDMAPALVIASQFVLGTIFGIIGLVVATPLAGVGLVLVRKLYVERKP